MENAKTEIRTGTGRAKEAFQKLINVENLVRNKEKKAGLLCDIDEEKEKTDIAK